MITVSRRAQVWDLICPTLRCMREESGVDIGLVTILPDNRPKDQWETLPIVARAPDRKQIEVWTEAEDETGEWKAKLWPRLRGLVE